MDRQYVADRTQTNFEEDLSFYEDDDHSPNNTIERGPIQSSKLHGSKNMNGSSLVLNKWNGSQQSQQETLTDYTQNVDTRFFNTQKATIEQNHPEIIHTREPSKNRLQSHK